MQLRELLESSTLSWGADSQSLDIEIAGITDDFRKVEPGFLFIAIKGFTHDGHERISEAFEKGAVAAVYENDVEGSSGILIRVENCRQALGLLWASWNGWPSRKLRVVGVTGTEGKTTTCNLIYQILESSGRKGGLISTISARIGGMELDTGAHVTSPGPEMVQTLLSQMVESHSEVAVLEVTSHAIDQHRYAGVEFDIAAVTNITRDHFDYHITFENYRDTKAKLIEWAQTSVLNKDDVNFEFLSKKAKRTVSYSIRESADIEALEISFVGTGSKFNLGASGDQVVVELHLPGEYNVSNALAATGVCLELGVGLQEAASGLGMVRTLEGRFEEIKNNRGFRVFVDFAHTPSSLHAVLLAARNVAGEGKVICVFGAPGERDPEKRPLMGEVAGKLADVSILTMDDPRSEQVEDVVEQIAMGCGKAGAAEVSKDELKLADRKVYTKVVDRKEAIKLALGVAEPGDVVLLAGKGHEKMMAMASGDQPWSDQGVARELLTPEN